MNQYVFFVLGIILGIAIAIYFWTDREEKIEKEIQSNQKIYSTEKLNMTMEDVVKNINDVMKVAKRELTEDEKNEIIEKCYQDKFYS